MVFLALNSIEQLVEIGKPVVITLHDMWYFTGGCHLSFDCTNYQNRCGQCFYLRKQNEVDLSRKLYVSKEKIYRQKNITFVACSQWMRSKAMSSPMLHSSKIVTLPNAFDASVFCPASKQEIREILQLSDNKILILYGAANATNQNKGFEFLVKGIEQLLLKYPFLELQIELVILGKSNTNIAKYFSVPVNYLGIIRSDSKMAQIYQSVDLFVLPTLIDNLPNMVIESMSCGTPVVAFNTGGVPEIIDHQYNGYVAEYKSAEDLASGIKWVLENNHENVLGKAAREKVLREFSDEVVAQKYIDLYQNILNETSS